MSRAAWEGYSLEKQRKLVELFIASNPNDCRDAPTSNVRGYLRVAWGIDYPASARANDVLLGYCKAWSEGE